jgi:hypothetical protein
MAGAGPCHFPAQILQLKNGAGSELQCVSQLRRRQRQRPHRICVWPSYCFVELDVQVVMMLLLLLLLLLVVVVVVVMVMVMVVTVVMVMVVVVDSALHRA